MRETMKSIDKANEKLVEVISSLIEIRQQDLTLEQKDQLLEVINQLEEMRGFIFDIHNEINSKVS